MDNGRIAAREDGPVKRLDLAALIGGGDGTAFTYTITRPPLEGIASVRGHVLRFNPGPDFQDLSEGEIRRLQMEITATGPDGEELSSRVTLSVRGANDAPEIEASVITTSEDGPVVRLNLGAIATDPDGDRLSYEITGAPGLGKASLNGSMLRFNPLNDFQDLKEGQTRAVKIEVTATDPYGQSTTEEVTVRVIGTNDAPDMVAGWMVAAEDGPVRRLDLDTIASDPEGGALSYAIVGQPDEGIASIRGSTLRFRAGDDFQDLAPGEHRDVEVAVLATDPQGVSSREVVTVRVLGRTDAPEIEAVRLQTTEDGPVARLDLDTITTDPEGDAVTYEITGAPELGKATLRGSTLRFNPGQDFQFLDEGQRRNVQIEVTATDSTGERSVQVITASVTGADDGPVLRPAVLRAREDGDPVQLNLNRIYDDPDSSGPISYVIAGDIKAGTARINGSTLIYDPGDGFQTMAMGEVRKVFVPVTAFENGGSPTTFNVTVEVRGRNDNPTFRSYRFDTDPETKTGEVNLRRYTDDIDKSDRSKPFVYEIIEQPNVGRAWVEGNTLYYDAMDESDFLKEGQVGRFDAKIRITDANGGSTEGFVGFRVEGENDAPVFLPENRVFTVSADDLAIIDYRDVFMDPEGETLVYGVNGNNRPEVDTDYNSGGFLTFDPGRLYQDLEPGQTRSRYFSVRAEDQEFSTGWKTIEIQVVGQPDPVGRPSGFGFQIVGGVENSRLAYTLQNVGDLDNDGIDDLYVAQGNYVPSQGSGQPSTTSPDAFVLFGRDQSAGEFFPSRVSAVSSTGATDLYPGQDQDFLGSAVAPLGDVNGDGIDDILIGSRAKDTLFVLFGRDGQPFDLQTDLSALDGSDGFALRHRIDGQVGEILAEDLDGDGLNDILIQGPDNGTYSVVFGRSTGFGASVDVAALAPDEGTVFAAETFFNMGDVNGDGFDDLVIESEAEGGTYLVFGDAQGWWDATSGFRDWTDGDSVLLTGPESFEVSKTRIDINGDGLNDIVARDNSLYLDVLGYVYDFPSDVYVVYGRDSGFGTTLDLLDLDGSDGFTLRNYWHDETGTLSASNAGDVNGDGIEDLIVSGVYADGYTATVDDLHKTYHFNRVSFLLFGTDEGFNADIELKELDGSDGYRIIGEWQDSDFLSGGRAEGAGDINGDGFDDLVIGDYRLEVDGAENAGKAYVIFGGPGLSDYDASDGTEDGTLYLSALSGVQELF
ncbi:hypothetical protein ATO3_18360 [Marinibacterium profundimaris]|uniref:Cadherin domain-containing protein n=2 Tax=Marinibacterium profundimaris TaxID=1679460 RepID=A0A225NEW1_9RHOB|nr:hypothetical protein ATO3_18360 [Marinibacterium profundimaris]